MSLLYTIMPPEQIFGEQKSHRSSFICRNGILLEGERKGEYFQIKRVLSTDPSVYLDRRLFPGGMIRG